jgi:hypothetical protein
MKMRLAPMARIAVKMARYGVVYVPDAMVMLDKPTVGPRAEKTTSHPSIAELRSLSSVIWPSTI